MNEQVHSVSVIVDGKCKWTNNKNKFSEKTLFRKEWCKEYNLGTDTDSADLKLCSSHFFIYEQTKIKGGIYKCYAIFVFKCVIFHKNIINHDIEIIHK